MNNIKTFLHLLILLLTPSTMFAQVSKNIFNEITGEKFNPENFTLSTKTLKQNAGVYHFGESEGEWSLVVIPFNDSLIIQVWNGTWAEELGFKNQAWLQKCQTFNRVKTEDNRFYFGNYSGQFVEYNDGKSKIKSVLLFSDPIQGKNYRKDSAQVGFYSISIETFFDDQERYTLSSEVKPAAYFEGKTKQELKIMRNTIFANYGFIFQKGGEMEKHFIKKDWYQPWQNDVSFFLTEIEKENLITIKKFEEL